jgi:hypothetical protein
MTARFKFMRRAEAAKYIEREHGFPCSAKTLAKYAVTGAGPAFQKIGPWPLYTERWCDEWVESKTSKMVRCTSELKIGSLVRSTSEARANSN